MILDTKADSRRSPITTGDSTKSQTLQKITGVPDTKGDSRGSLTLQKIAGVPDIKGDRGGPRH